MVIESITLAVGMIKLLESMSTWLEGNDSDARKAKESLDIAEDFLANYLQVHPDPSGLAILQSIRYSKAQLGSSPVISEMLRKVVLGIFKSLSEWAGPRSFRESSKAVADEARSGLGIRLAPVVVLVLAFACGASGCRMTHERIDRSGTPAMLTVQFPDQVTTKTLSIHERDGRVWVAAPLHD